MQDEDSVTDATAAAMPHDDTKMAEDDAAAINTETTDTAASNANPLRELLLVNRPQQELSKSEQEEEQQLIQQELTLRQNRESKFAHLHWKLDGSSVHHQMIPRTLLPVQLQKRFAQQKQRAAAANASTNNSNRVKLRLAKDTTEDSLRPPPTQSDIANISKIRPHHLTAEYPSSTYKEEDEIVKLNEVTPAQAVNHDLTAGYEYPTALKAPYHQVTGAVTQSIPANAAQSHQQFPYTSNVIARQNGSEVPAPRFPIIIPSYAAWYDPNAIHDIERRAFPEMLLPPADREDGGSYKSKQPALRLVKTYKDIREYIIATYRINPRVYLTATACRRHIVGDTSAVIRIHHFLNRWGLINYRVDPGTVPVMHNSYGSVNYPVLRHLPNGALVPHNAGQPTLSVDDNNRNSTANDSKATAADPLQRLMTTTDPSGKLALRHHILRGAASTVDPIYQHSVQHPKPDTSTHCVVCKKATTNQYYVPKQQHTYTICPVCYADGLYDPIYTSADFVRNNEQTEVSAATQSKWTQEETLKLLEALTRYGDDWSAVSETVGSKSRDECVLHFLSLPIEEPFLSASYPNASNNQTTADDAQVASNNKQSTALFSDTPNPLMTTIAFLASAISPSVASAAAQAAIGQLQPPPAKHADKQKSTTADPQASVSTDELDVSTPYGPGRLLGRRLEDATVIVQLPFAVGYIAEVDIRPLTKAESSKSDEPKSSADQDVEMASEQAANSRQADNTNNMTDFSNPDTLASLVDTAVSTAASKAGELAAEEERKVLRLVAQLVQAQMRKVELKLSHLEELNTWSSTQKIALERSWKQVMAERISLAPVNAPSMQQPAQVQTPMHSSPQQHSPAMHSSFPSLTSPASEHALHQQQQQQYSYNH